MIYQRIEVRTIFLTIYRFGEHHSNLLNSVNENLCLQSDMFS